MKTIAKKTYTHALLLLFSLSLLLRRSLHHTHTGRQTRIPFGGREEGSFDGERNRMRAHTLRLIVSLSSLSSRILADETHERKAAAE